MGFWIGNKRCENYPDLQRTSYLEFLNTVKLENLSVTALVDSVLFVTVNSTLTYCLSPSLTHDRTVAAALVGIEKAVSNDSAGVGGVMVMLPPDFVKVVVLPPRLVIVKEFELLDSGEQLSPPLITNSILDSALFPS